MEGAFIPDWTLVERVQAGEDDAFGALMARYNRPVLHFVHRMIGDSTEAQDIAQEVFVRAYRAMLKPGFRRTSAEFSTWLFQVARNAALDVLRRRKRRPTDSLEVLLESGHALSHNGPTAASEAIAAETGEQIAAAVSLLPEDQRAAILLSEYEGLPDARVAALLKCSVKSVQSRLYRARRFLRVRLAHLLQ